MQKDTTDFSEGGDPPCWAHLFDEESGDETASLPSTESNSPIDGVVETTHTERREIAR